MVLLKRSPSDLRDPYGSVLIHVKWPFHGSKPRFSWFSAAIHVKIMKMRDFMVQDPCEIIWFSDFTWLNYENGPFDGSQPHFHGSAIAMSSQVHDARYLLALLMDILLCNVLMLSTSVASSGIIGGMQKSSYFGYMGID